MKIFRFESTGLLSNYVDKILCFDSDTGKLNVADGQFSITDYDDFLLTNKIKQHFDISSSDRVIYNEKVNSSYSAP